jgi:hypothetical protein
MSLFARRTQRRLTGLRADVYTQRQDAFQNKSGGALRRFRVVPFFFERPISGTGGPADVSILLVNLTLGTASTNLPFPAGHHHLPGYFSRAVTAHLEATSCINLSSETCGQNISRADSLYHHPFPHDDMLMVQHGARTIQFQMLVNLVQNRCHPISTPHYSAARKISNQIAPAHLHPPHATSMFH